MVAAAQDPQTLAPGMRVVIRDAEWVIRKVDTASDGGQQLTCDGVSELVRDKTALFLTRLEDDIQVLDPALTRLVQDDSPGYSDSLLSIESQLRRQSINDDKIHIAHQGAMDLVPYQLDPAIQALKQPRQRILIADAVGLGKTLEAGILVTELIHRGRGKRILVLTLKSMLTQFQKEFWNRFTIPLTRLDSVGLQRVRNRIPSNHNPFYYYDKSIISIDTLKQDSEYRVYLEQAYWDIIIIDECHNVADRGSSSQRARLARLLATRSDTLIMLSATPHDGRARSFASLMNMLDPTAISDPENYAREDFRHKGLVIRRFKKDIRDQVESEFRERVVCRHHHPATNQEEAAYEALLAVPFTQKGEFVADKRSALLRIGFQKALFSSPAACRKSIAERISKLANREPSSAIADEQDALQTLDQQLALITPDHYSKYQALLKLITGKVYGWKKSTKDDRLVIFSERIETLSFLQQQLQRDLKLKDKQLTQLHGGLSDLEQQQIVEQFGSPASPLRLLLCSDVASEGINLHYQSHRLIHFDLPWSLMVFQQRNGRIDRYGQEQIPRIDYLITESANPVVRGDMRILEVLEEKDEQAYRDIGDPSVFMGVFDPEAETKLTEQAMLDGQSATDFDRQYQPPPEDHQSEGDELLALFLGTASPEQPQAPAVDDAPLPIVEPLSLYDDPYRWARDALQQLENRGEPLQWAADDKNQHLTLTITEDLHQRFKYLPREIYPENGQFILTDDLAVIKQEIARSREDENAWPKIHYLWPRHPLSEWLADRMLTAFGRHTAPVIEYAQGLEHNETVFIIAGVVPNRKSHPLVNEWLAVCFRNGRFHCIDTFATLLQRTRLGSTPIPNRQTERSLEPMQTLLPEAVSHARQWIIEKRDAFEQQINRQLDAQLQELDRLRRRQMQQLEMKLQGSRVPENRKAQLRATGEADIDQLFDDYIDWIEDTMTTERQPWLQVIAVLTHPEG